jgi:hypothetical protein
VSSSRPLTEGPRTFADPNIFGMEPKKEHTEREEDGTRVERTSYYDPDTGTHGEKIKVEKTEEEPSEDDQ